MTLAVGFFWPFDATNALQGASLMIAILVLLATVPAGWYLLRRRFGLWAAGPLWALLLFEVFASLYALAVPPWQMPDEPQHMVHVEVVRRAGPGAAQRLAGNHPTPSDSKVDLQIEQSMVASLRDSNAVRLLPGATEPLRAGKVPGPSELLHPPLYYEVAAIVSTPFGGAPLLARLAVVRTLGIVLAAWTVWACGAVARFLWPTRPRMAEVPLALAAGLPTFALFAGAVNNDALANLLGALLVLVLAGWVVREPRFRNPTIVGLVLAALVLAGLGTKRTFIPLVLLIPVAAVLRSARRVTIVLAVAIAIEGVGAMYLLAAPGGRLALWQGAPFTRSFRCRQPKDGRWAICLPAHPGSDVTQSIPQIRLRQLRDRDVTFGAWVRADDPTTGAFLDVVADGQTRFASVRSVPGPDWQFVSVTGRVPATARLLSVDIGSVAGVGNVFADDAVLAAGRYADPPTSVTGGHVTWDGQKLRNELANGSAELATIKAPGHVPVSIQNGIAGVIDSVDAVAHEPGRVLVSRNLLFDRMSLAAAMFWSTVGWSIPPPVLPVPLQVVLGAVALVGLGGAAAAVLLGRGRAATPLLGLLLAGAGVSIAAVLLRDIPPTREVVVSGRYFFVGITSIAAVLAVGWRVAWFGDDRSLRRVVRISALVLHALFVAFVLIPYLTGGRSAGSEIALRSTACPSRPSRPTTRRIAPSLLPTSSGARPSSATPACTTRRAPTGRASGPSRPSPSTGSTSGTPSSSGSSRSPAGS